MNSIQKSAFDAEIALANVIFAEGALDAGFKHLERAHVIGQAYVVPHVKSHWLMLKVELRRRRSLGIVGQAVRILLGAVGSAVGVVPAGNTGGSDISMFKRMPIDPDLRDIVEGRVPDNSLKADVPVGSPP